MEGNIHVDLSESIEQDLRNVYQGLCDDLGKELGNMRGELEEICGRTKYEPMVEAVNQTIELFDTEIRDVADRAFNEWCEGEGSFPSAAENSQTGDAGTETARQIEQSIRDLFETFWTSKPMGDAVQTDTSRPEIKGEDFEDLKEVYNRCYQGIEDVGEKALSSIEGKGEDNPTYSIIIPAVKALFEPIKNAFEQFAAKADEAREKSEELKQAQESRNEEAAESITETTATAEEIADALFDKFLDV